MKRFSKLRLGFIGLFLGAVLFVFGISQGGLQAAENQFQQGIVRYQAGDWRGAIGLWQHSLSQHPEQAIEQKRTTWQYLARAYQQLGELQRAIDTFDTLFTSYPATQDNAQRSRILAEKAQIFADLGQYRRAIALLCETPSFTACRSDSALALAQQSKDAVGEAAALGSLGTVYYLQGDYDLALTALQQSQTIAERINNVDYLMSIREHLGNLYSSLAMRDARYLKFSMQAQDQASMQRFQQRRDQHYQQAIAAFSQSLNLAQQQQDLPSQVRARLGLMIPLSRQRSSLGAAELNQVTTAIQQLPNSREKSYALIKLAGSLAQVAANSDVGLASDYCANVDTQPYLKNARDVAQAIADRETSSFAIGLLGHQAECDGDRTAALNLTQQAALLTTRDEVRYLWEWQTGRILQAQNQPVAALDAYDRSVNSLSQIQGNIAAANRDLRLDFQENSEAIYRQLAILRFAQADRQPLQQQQTQLSLAASALDGLRLVELQNYLGSQCEIPIATASLTAANAKTATFQSLLLDDRLVILARLPEANGTSKLKFHQVALDRSTVMNRVNAFRRQLEQRSDRENQFEASAQELYRWFIQPFEADLAARSIQTLVFVQDDILRTVPMAALSDGQNFLVQRYEIANTASLQLPRPQPQQDYQTQILAFGLTQPAAIDDKTFFSPLGAVQTEVATIQKVIDRSNSFLDEDFTPERLQTELKRSRPRILHLATHARFGFDARETFLVTGRATSQAFNSVVSLNDVYKLLRSNQSDSLPLELLALTGCDTAAGSSRDALGIAGVAVQAGAQSAIASLWQIDDAATAKLVVQFYQNLRDGMSKSAALQEAQRSWLKDNPTGSYRHPGYWAPFILVGNWL
jgi:CHAT domain-containing protein